MNIKNNVVFLLVLSTILVSCLQADESDVNEQNSNYIRMQLNDSLSLISTLDTSSIVKSFVDHCRKNKVSYFSNVWIDYQLNSDSSWTLVKIEEPSTYKINHVVDFTKQYFGNYNFIAPGDKMLYLTVEMNYHLEGVSIFPTQNYLSETS